MFSRGAQPARNGVYPFELRPQSVKGVLRFWFRALAPLVIDVYELDFSNLSNSKRKEWEKKFGKEKYKGLKYLESLIFGSQDMKAPFRVIVDFNQNQISSNELRWSEKPPKSQNERIKLFEIAENILYGVQDRNNKSSYLPPDTEFSLYFRCENDEIWKILFMLLKTVSVFSGFGAKTRKGLGEFEIISPSSERNFDSYKKFVKESSNELAEFVENHNKKAGANLPQFKLGPTIFKENPPEFPNFCDFHIFNLKKRITGNTYEKVMRELYYLRGQREERGDGRKIVEILEKGWYLQLKNKLRTYNGDNVHELIEALLDKRKELTLYPSIVGLPIQYQNLRVPKDIRVPDKNLRTAVQKVRTSITSSLKGLVEVRDESGRKASPLFISIHKQDNGEWYPLILLMKSQITNERKIVNDQLNLYLKKEHNTKKEDEKYLNDINKDFKIKAFEDFETLRQLIKELGGVEDDDE